MIKNLLMAAIGFFSMVLVGLVAIKVLIPGAQAESTNVERHYKCNNGVVVQDARTRSGDIQRTIFPKNVSEGVYICSMFSRDFPNGRHGLTLHISGNSAEEGFEYFSPPTDRSVSSSKVINLKSKGKHRYIPAKVNGESVLFMLDSGCTGIAVGTETFEKFKSSARFLHNSIGETAGGRVETSVYSVILDVQGLVFDVEMTVLPMPTVAGSEGLIGQRLLDMFDSYTVNKATNELILGSRVGR